MSFKVVEDLCIGCGACDFTCPTGALEKTDSFLGLFAIDPFTCDDCGQCVPACPVVAIVPDDEWAVCRGHGCPLGSKRLGAFDCAVWQQRCPECDTTMWRSPDGAEGEWVCPTHGLAMRVRCPRTNRLPAAAVGA